MEKEEFYKYIIEFLEEKNSTTIVGLKPEDDLIKIGLLDSFMMIEIIIKIESLLNKPLDTDALKVDHISSVSAMYQYFVRGER